MIRTKIFIVFLILALTVQCILFAKGNSKNNMAAHNGIVTKRLLVKHLGLTDLSLWTEARYSRHPSQADLFTSFQDFPGSLDHFPAGSIIAPNIIGLNTSILVRKSQKMEQFITANTKDYR